MRTPTVSFIVPCYKLAHLLPECVESILSQSFGDFELLIMDDASPDDTETVARSFSDARIKYIRNQTNLGHLRNYNKGIGLAKGRYIWLISADDRLRRPYILKRYLEQLERNPSVGYACCSGVELKDGRETGLIEYSAYSDRDRIVHGHEFLKRLLRLNFVLAASGLARRQCYDRLGLFPLDMPWAGDWYLWCLFAMHFDVAYFAEPMVCYRQHELSMTSSLMQKSALACCEEDVAIAWAIKQKAEQAGFRKLSRECLNAVAFFYSRNIASKRYAMSQPSSTLDQLEESLTRHCPNAQERRKVRALVYSGIASEYYWQGDSALAETFSRAALKENPLMLDVRFKKLLLSLGKPGDFVRKTLSSMR